jgi:hypothetical protein
MMLSIQSVCTPSSLRPKKVGCSVAPCNATRQAQLLSSRDTLD